MKFGRFLPYIGSIFSFGFAINKFMKGDMVGGTLELVSGIVNLLPGGMFVSAILDGYILYRDFQKSKKEDSGVDADSGKPGMLSRIWTSVKGWFAAHAEKLPIIGGIMKMGEAAGHLLKGEWKSGFRSLYQIVPSLIGGSTLGNLAGKGFDFIGGLFGGNEDSVQAPSGDSNSIKKMDTGMKKSLADRAKNLPIIGGILKMGETAKMLLSGDFLGGVKSLKSFIPSWISGSSAGSAVGKGFDFVTGLFDGGDDVDYDSINTDTDGNSFSTMVSSMFSKVGDILGNVWGGIKSKAAKWRDKAMSTFGRWGKAIGGFADDHLGTNLMGDSSSATTSQSSQSGNGAGAFDKLLAANSAIMAELNSINKNQLNVLISIRDGINTLVSQSGGSAAGGSNTEISFTNNPLTQEFYA